MQKQSKKIHDEIWILADNRPGTFSQGIALATEIGLQYKIINLQYSFLSFLPNFIFSRSFLRLSQDTQNKINNLDYLPKIIISAGRRSAPIALNIKEKSKNQIKIIQIMNPNLNFKNFDFVILPEHDNLNKSNYKNLITTIGALTKVNENSLLKEKEKFAQDFANITKPKITVLLGGSSKKTIFTKESAINLAKQLSQISNNMSAVLLILNSRRTDEVLNKSFIDNLNCDFKFFDWKEVKENNPYIAVLGYSDYFVITGDSVSMISECCATGKPVYIFDEEKISSTKHRRFHDSLIQNNYAKKLLNNLTKLDNFLPKILQETKRVSSLIKTNL